MGKGPWEMWGLFDEEGNLYMVDADDPMPEIYENEVDAMIHENDMGIRSVVKKVRITVVEEPE